MRFIKNIISVLILIALGNSAIAQVFPVQGNAALIPPYSVYLSDYTSRTNDRLLMNIVLNDMARPSLPVRLRLKIQGQNISVETKAEYIGQPISLQGGIPLRLTGTDLIEYFNPDNLNFSGISRREFEKTGALPQGFYQFCFEVLEYNRGVKISNTICAPGWLILNDPPIVNLPRNNEKLKPSLPQNVIFQWTPRHTGSPNSAFATEYELTMVEIWPATRNPNDAILTSPPILETTTRSTTFIYGPAETPLEPGRRYAFRVKAKSIVGSEEYDLFKNNGYSEVYSFMYGDACGSLTDVKVTVVGSSRFNVSWAGQSNHTGYNLRYREAGTTQWYENSSIINEIEVSKLKPLTTYEYQVSGDCGILDGQYSSIATIKTKETPATIYSCGVPLETFTLDPAQLTGSLNIGDIIQAGDFAVTLTKVTGSNGLFSGEGVIEVPYFNKAKVKIAFDNIAVNKELRMVNGVLNVTGAGVDVIPGGVMNFMEQLTEVLDQLDTALNTIEQNLPEHFDPHSFVPDTLITVSEGINSVYKDSDGTVVIVDQKGTETRLPAGTTVAVTDDAGKGYMVDSKGNRHKTTAAIAATAGKREYNLTLEFAQDPAAKNGFDQKEHDPIASEYEQLKGGYWVAWKAVESGKTDPVIARMGNSAIDKSKIRFEMGGVVVSAPPLGNSQTTTIQVPGKTDGTVEDLIAIYTPAGTDKQQVLGKLKIATYSNISKEVVLVPVNGAKLPGTVDEVSKRLHEIYQQAVVTWKVTQATEGVQVVFDPQFDDGESGLFTNYTPDMKKVINAYKANMVEDKLYLFIIDHPTKSGTGALGYMPRSKQAGFIFAKNHHSTLDFATTVAHELGHGAFNLQHTFVEYPLLTGTDNVMDYPAGSRVYKYQWSKIRFKDIVIGLFEQDEDSELLGSCETNVDFLISGSTYPKDYFKDVPHSEVTLVDYIKQQKLWKAGEIVSSYDAVKENFVKKYYLTYNSKTNVWDFDGIEFLKKNNNWEALQKAKAIATIIVLKWDQVIFNSAHAKYCKRYSVASANQARKSFTTFLAENYLKSSKANSKGEFTSIDNKISKIPDARAYYSTANRTYDLEMFKRDLQYYVIKNFANLLTGSEEGDRALETQYLNWSKKFADYMVVVGVDQIPNLTAESTKINLIAEFQKIRENASLDNEIRFRWSFLVKEREHRELLEAQEALRRETAEKEARAIAEADATRQAYIDITIGTSTIVFTVLFPPATILEAVVAVGSGAFALDQLYGGVSTLAAIQDKTFDPKTEYKLIRGYLVRIESKDAIQFYDFSNIVFGVASAGYNTADLLDIKKVKPIILMGDELKALLKAKETGVDYYDTSNDAIDGYKFYFKK